VETSQFVGHHFSYSILTVLHFLTIDGGGRQLFTLSFRRKKNSIKKVTDGLKLIYLLIVP